MRNARLALDCKVLSLHRNIEWGLWCISIVNRREGRTTGGLGLLCSPPAYLGTLSKLSIPAERRRRPTYPNPLPRKVRGPRHTIHSHPPADGPREPASGPSSLRKLRGMLPSAARRGAFGLGINASDYNQLTCDTILSIMYHTSCL